MTTVDEKVADTLEKAVDVIRTDGWCQGTFRDGDGRVCAVGAIRTAAGISLYGEEFTTYGAMCTSEVTEIRVQRRLGLVAIASWNDERGRKKEDVIDLFLEIAKDLRNEAKPS